MRPLNELIKRITLMSYDVESTDKVRIEYQELQMLKNTILDQQQEIKRLKIAERRALNKAALAEISLDILV